MSVKHVFMHYVIKLIWLYSLLHLCRNGDDAERNKANQILQCCLKNTKHSTVYSAVIWDFNSFSLRVTHITRRSHTAMEAFFHH